MSTSNRKPAQDELPEGIRLTINGKIVLAHCTICGAFLAAGQSVERLETVIRIHNCVRDGKG